MGEAPFLGVSRSALGRRWIDRLDAARAREAAAISGAHGVSEVLARVLAGRGVTADAVPGHLEPRLREALPDPASMVDAEAAAARLDAAVSARETVAIFGDYDVDGACSAALLAEALRRQGLDPIVHIPDRLTEGYGPNSSAIARFAEAGATLLVCVDCGTSGHEPLADAARLGLDVLVIDHHQAPETLPAVRALVNPNRQDDLSGLGHLCAAGVTFLVLVALNRRLRERRGVELDLLGALDLVALATVADVMPLTGLNRAFVAQGLKVIRGRARPGLAALQDVARLNGAAEAWHLGFYLGPRINAGGRIGDSGLGARLLLTADPAEAERIAGELDRLNRERQTIEDGMLQEAEADALAALGDPDSDTPTVLAVGGERWHPGIVGIVAGRLKERFRRPAFAFAPNGEGGWTGSGRSLPGVDLGRAVRAALGEGLALKGGGHAMAAGVTVPEGGIAAFAARLEADLAAEVAAARAADALAIDAGMTAESLGVAMVRDLARAGPFGQGNPEPVLVLPAHRVQEVIALKGGHLKAILTTSHGARAEVMAFRAEGRPLGDALMAARGRDIHAAVQASVDEWGGRERVSLRLIDLALR